MSLVLTISAKDFNQNLKSKTQKIILNNGVDRHKNIKENIDFLAQQIREEVISGELSQQKKKIRKLKKIYKKFVLILGVAVVTTPIPVFAETQETPSSIELGANGEITPNVIMEWGLKIALMTVAVGVAISGALLAIAGVYRMLRKRREAQEWTADIILGLVQVLIAVPTVYALFHLAQVVFQNIPLINELL